MAQDKSSKASDTEGTKPAAKLDNNGGNSAGSTRSSLSVSAPLWKPNADAAEWKPSFDGGESGGKSSTSKIESTTSDVVNDKQSSQHQGQTERTGRAASETVTRDERNMVATTDIDEEQANGATMPVATPTAGVASVEGNRSSAKRRYEIDFMLKLRPKPETTPKPAGLNPPDRVDILWDGKEPPPPDTASMRSSLRPLPPLGRQASRGLGEARGAPPPLRGAQRSVGRDSRFEQRGPRDDQRRTSDRDSRGGGVGSGGGGGGGRDRGGGGHRRAHVDTAPALEDCEPIKINEATRWKPKSLQSKRGGGADATDVPVEEVLMKTNAILNKMTLEKFPKLSVTFMQIGLRDPEVVAGVIDMLVEKAQMEPHFSGMYAKLCELIAHTPIPGLGEDPDGKDAGKGSKKFRKMLLIKCQEEFEKDWQGLFAAVQSDDSLAEDEKAEKEFVLKKKYMGHMRFVGELYKVELLKEKRVQAAIHDMLGSTDNPDEERLECMVKLLTTCGKKLDQTGSPDTMKDMKRLFKRIAKLADNRQVSSRIRFMLRDLLELRKNHWVPRREEEKAKTMQELHNDIAKEGESKNSRSSRGGSSRDHHSSGISSSSIRPGSGDARVNTGARPEASSSVSRPASQQALKDEEGWETVPKKGKSSATGDGWNQVPAARVRSNTSGPDDRRGGAAGGSTSGGGGGGMSGGGGGLSAFALLGTQDDDKEKKRKKKTSKDKKEKSSKSSREKEKDSGKKKERAGSASSSASTSVKGMKTAPPTPSGAASTKIVPPSSTGSKPVTATSSTMTEEMARKMGKEGAAEYAVSNDLDEACTCLSEVDASLRWAAVSEAISDSMERKQKHREALGDLLTAASKEGILSGEDLLKGLKDVLDLLPDVEIDVPQASKYVATIVVALSSGGHLLPGPLLADPPEGLLEGGRAASFAAVTMGQLKLAAEADGMSADEAAGRVRDLVGGLLDISKLAAMLPVLCRGDEAKAKALLDREGVSL